MKGGGRVTEFEKLKVTDAIESAVSDTENNDEKRLKAFAGKINRKRNIVIWSPKR